MRTQEEQEQLLFFIPNIQPAQQFKLPEDIVRHLQAKRCLTINQSLLLSRGDVFFHASILSITKKDVFVSLGPPQQIDYQPSQVHLFQAILKPESFAWVVQKATEMNVQSLTPVWTKRCQRHYWSESKKEHYLKVIQSACAQSERMSPLILHDPISLDELDHQSYYWVRADFDGKPWSQLKLSLPLALLVGPEGGFDLEEEKLLPCGQTVSLGKSILRAETASIVLCGLALCS